MPDLRAALAAQGFGPMDLHLEADEAATLLSLMKLGMDAWAGNPRDEACARRLDRLPEAGFPRLAAKLTAATKAMTANVAAGAQGQSQSSG